MASTSTSHSFEAEDSNASNASIVASKSDSTPEQIELVHHHVGSLPLGAPAKKFFLEMFHSQEKFGGKKEGGGRDVIKVHGSCKVCGKRVTGTDSYYLFKQHYQTAHAEALSLQAEDEESRKRKSGELLDGDEDLAAEAAEATLLLDISPHEDVEFLPFDRPDKDFFQQLYLGHEAIPATRRNGVGVYKYSATCKRCSKKVTGLGSVAIFKQHFKKNHPLAGEDADTAGDSAIGQTLSSSSKLSSNGDFTAKHYFETMYSGHELYKEPKGSGGQRGVNRFTANCNVCTKKITGVDSFYNFRQHYYRVHEGAQIPNGLSEFIVIPFKNPQLPRSTDDVDSEERETDEQQVSGVAKVPKASAKQYFTNMFKDHGCMKSRTDTKKGSRKRFWATCKACDKLVGATDTFNNFRQHYDISHKEAEFDPAGFVDVEHLLNPPLQEDENPTAVNPAKRRRIKESHPAASDETIAAEVEPVSPRKHIEPHGPEQRDLDRNVSLCIVEALAPVSVFTVAGFRKLLADVEPGLTWPDASSLLEHHLPDLYSARRTSTLNACKNIATASVTLWTKGSFAALLARSVDEKWMIRNQVLMIKRNSDGTPFGAAALIKLFMAALQDFGVKEKIICVREYMAKGTDEEIMLPSCLVAGEPDVDSRKNRGTKEIREKIVEQCKVQQGKFKVHMIETLLDKAIESAMKKSAGLMKAVRKVIGNAGKAQEEDELPKNVLSSRWASVFRMVQEAGKTNWEMTKTFKLTPAEQNLLTEFTRVAESFEECFVKLEESELPTICDVIPFVYGLQKWLTAYGNEIEHLGQFIQDLSEEIETAFKEMDEDRMCVTATFLDPKYKLIWVKGSETPNKADQVKKLILEQMTTKTGSGSGSQPRRSTLLSFMNETPKGKNEMTAEEELQAYLDDEETSQNPLDFWRAGHLKFKKLGMLARSVFCISASMTEDRMFTNITENERMLELFEGDVDELLFCHMNRNLTKSN